MWTAQLNTSIEGRAVYDGLGQRVQSVENGTTRTLVYDIFGQLIAEYGGQAAGTGGTHYLMLDVQGSTRVVMKGSGAIEARHDFLPFGEEIPSDTGLRTAARGYAPVDSTRQRYAGMERDANGLDHTLWRKYESRGGRWTSPDPYRGSMEVGDPQSFNRYAYVGNDPVNRVDPSGLDWFFDHGFDASAGGFISQGMFRPYSDPELRYGFGAIHHSAEMEEGENRFIDWMNTSLYSMIYTINATLSFNGRTWDAGSAVYVDVFVAAMYMHSIEQSSPRPVKPSEMPLSAEEIKRRIDVGRAWEIWRSWWQCADQLRNNNQASYNDDVKGHERTGKGLISLSIITGFVAPGIGTLAVSIGTIGVQGISEYNSYDKARSTFLREAQQKCGAMPPKPEIHN